MRALIPQSSIVLRWRPALAFCVLAAGLLCASACGVSSRAAEANASFPHATVDSVKAAGPLQTAVLAGGCFWGTQAVFEHVRGVKRVMAGYAGGPQNAATYAQVSTGRTGHAESIQITFDPREVSYGEILRVFFSVAHDPTELDRQGPDVGTQYRSVIFYAAADQQRIALAYIAQLQHAQLFHRAIITRVEPLAGFYPAEGYHQDFLVRHPYDPYIIYNDLPKLSNLQRVLPDDYSERPALVAQSR